MTPLEAVGAVLTLLGALGLGIIAVDWLRERGKPAHNHPEGSWRASCPRCGLPENQRGRR